MKWLKDNLFNVVNFIILIYVIFELTSIKKIAEQTNEEALLNNVKLDYVESDINTKEIKDSLIKVRDSIKKTRQ